MSAPRPDFSKLAGDVKNQIVHLTAMLLDIPTEHAAYNHLATARSQLERAYGGLRASIVPDNAEPKRCR